MADEIKTNTTFEDGLVGFSGGKCPAKTLRAKVGEKGGGGGEGGEGGGGEGGGEGGEGS